MENQGIGNREGITQRTSQKQGIERQNRKVLSGKNQISETNESIGINEDQDFNDCSINLQDDQIILVDEQNKQEENIEEDIPTTQEEDEIVKEFLGGEDPRKYLDNLKEEYLETKKFYSKLRNMNQYDLTENDFKYWKGKPYVGTSYRQFIKKSSKIMVCTALINERIQIGLFDKLIKQKQEGNVPIEKGILKYVKNTTNNYIKTDIYYSKKSIEFLEWRFKSHLFRFGFIKKYLEDEYQLNYVDFKTYRDVETYFNLLM